MHHNSEPAAIMMEDQLVGQENKEVVWVEGDGSAQSGINSELLMHIYEVESDGEDPEDARMSNTDNHVYLTGILNSTKGARDAKGDRGNVRSWSLKRYMHDKMTTMVRECTEEYYLRLMNFISSDEFPSDILEIFEIIMDKRIDIYSCVRSETQRFNREFLHLSPSQRLRASLFRMRGIKALRHVMGLSLNLLLETSAFTETLAATMCNSGFIKKYSNEHGLYCYFFTKIVQLLQRIEYLSSICRKQFEFVICDNDVVYDALRRLQGTSASVVGYQSSFLTDVHFSGICELEDICLIVCTCVARVVACLSYVQMQELTEAKELDLASVLADFRISLEDLNDSLGSYINEYKRRMDREGNLQILKLREPPSTIFSREHRIRKQFAAIHDLSIEFADAIESIEDLARRLEDQQSSDRNDDTLVELIIKHQEHAERKLGYLKTLMDVQAVLVQQLKRKSLNSMICSGSTAIGSSVQASANENNVSETSTNNNNNNNAGPLEFRSATTTDTHHDETADVGVITDEIYIGVFTHTDADHETLMYNKNSDDLSEATSKIYTGVVSQLRKALEPVKAKMKQREREAKKKVFGQMMIDEQMEDCYSSGTESESESIISFGRKSVPLRQTVLTDGDDTVGVATRSYRCQRDSDNSPDVECTNPSFPLPPLLTELKFKLNSGINSVAMQNVTEVTFGSSGSESEPESNSD